MTLKWSKKEEIKTRTNSKAYDNEHSDNNKQCSCQRKTNPQTTSNIEKQKNALQLQISILKNKRVNRLKQKTFNVDKHRTITFTNERLAKTIQKNNKIQKQKS